MKKIIIKAVITMAKIARYLSIFICILGATGIAVNTGFTVYEFSTHIHRGFLEMTDSASSFLLFSSLITISLFWLGATGFSKAQSIIKKFEILKA